MYKNKHYIVPASFIDRLEEKIAQLTDVIDKIVVESYSFDADGVEDSPPRREGGITKEDLWNLF
jgi:hypothetical protein